jgi:hypothetical protein
MLLKQLQEEERREERREENQREECARMARKKVENPNINTHNNPNAIFIKMPAFQPTCCHTVKVFHSKDMKFWTILLHYKYFSESTDKLTNH